MSTLVSFFSASSSVIMDAEASRDATAISTADALRTAHATDGATNPPIAAAAPC